MDGDFKQWRTDRLMAHYQPVKPWCELVLYQQMPFALQGQWHGISMLFPMEKLFERYVEKALRRDLADGARLSLVKRLRMAADFGLKPMRSPADEDFHDLIAERYERSATIVTSNLDYNEWDQAFPANRLLASATLDRLRHNAYCLTLDGASYRSPKMAPAAAKTTPQKQ